MANSERKYSWLEIKRVVHPPFIDTRLNNTNVLENRSFKMRYFKNDQLLGQDSWYWMWWLPRTNQVPTWQTN